mmetsp:Transcript_350/g.1115  ORF Transcript_350/g.1115 Transcript_350/m.1115 type:complete len:214 (+) Transcript_350:341-982(+)
MSVRCTPHEFHGPTDNGRGAICVSHQPCKGDPLLVPMRLQVWPSAVESLSSGASSSNPCLCVSSVLAPCFKTMLRSALCTPKPQCWGQPPLACCALRMNRCGAENDILHSSTIGSLLRNPQLTSLAAANGLPVWHFSQIANRMLLSGALFQIREDTLIWQIPGPSQDPVRLERSEGLHLHRTRGVIVFNMKNLRTSKSFATGLPCAPWTEETI